MAAAAFLGGQSRLKAGCGQNCPPSNCKLAHFDAAKFRIKNTFAYPVDRRLKM